ncbi:endonuclease/exonuclease/phosphatase family protein [Mucilaginibacter sp.]|uniref:endonuclease/exonuclease/phosphatase family protein n=1 Tax=Mucilaginibacter sp. TaxID=1882438 RepID=UPI000CB9ADC3|nr:endonuclease/exonuclease/phosphatase family protein [Mucilaginibacter sp.]PLW89440.1 MAG: endonuclease [Mucilaginibacter sp.]HEK21707.1 endonuclease/exonuclease/phosphatase family protein [Bacteroidota bacterium]
MDIALGLFTCLLLTFTLLPLIRHDFWVFRVFDYPRLQKLFLNGVAVVLLLTFYSGNSTLKYLQLSLLAINIIYLLRLILPFTPLGKKQVLKATVNDKQKSLSLMIANVLQTNHNTQGCLNEIAKADPDVVILLEANSRWNKETSNLSEKYPFARKVPLENMYGLLFYSKLELVDTAVHYLVEQDIPSIHTKMKLRNGQLVQFYAVHPTPPAPGENLRSTERDKELLLIADLAKASELPVIVAGDLNDVAWSHTTDLFLKMSGLLDPRRGRGFFNSFNAHYFFLRFPLDHAFISRHFKLKKLKRLNNYNSDHFPIFLQIQLDEHAYAQQQPLIADSDDKEEAEEKKQKI